MATAAVARVAFPQPLDDTFARRLSGLYEAWLPTPVPAPRLLALNVELADELGLDPDLLGTDEGIAVLAGNAVPDGATPLAQAYSGHQFGNLSPVLGDGRALLLGELVDGSGNRRDLHLKGSGPTPFARRGDGKAAVGPMLREFLIGESMHALGIPTTRALAVVATGEPVRRGPALPGAVLARVAASHLRVGTFQYAAISGDRELLDRLTRYTIERHYPALADSDRPALALLDAVVTAQAELVAGWMLVGFVHGVMNTDNTTISGETIDYGPCAFVDAHDPTAVFSSIDHGGRYAFGNQPTIMQWNLARFAEALLAPITDEVGGATGAAVDAATEVLTRYRHRYQRAWYAGARRKLAIDGRDGDSGNLDDIAETKSDDDRAVALIDELVELMTAHRLDHTTTWRSLGAVLRGAEPDAALTDWAGRWRRAVLAADHGAGGDRTGDNTRDDATSADDTERLAAELDRRNPRYIARNHLVDEALEAATAGDLAPFETLLDVLRRPYDEHAGRERYAEPADERFNATFQTFCGT